MDPIPVRATWSIKASAGWVLMAGSPIACVVLGVIGALTVNPCGAFGDACDDDGQTTAFGTTMFAFALACRLAFIGGVAVLIAGSMQHWH